MCRTFLEDFDMDKNYFDFLKDIPESSRDEIFETILSHKDIKIERIISYGQVSDESFWYDQEEGEFVILLEGEAKIKYFEGKIFDLKRGTSLYIPAHQKHQVIYTSNPAIWLAVFIKN